MMGSWSRGREARRKRGKSKVDLVSCKGRGTSSMALVNEDKRDDVELVLRKWSTWLVVERTKVESRNEHVGRGTA